MTKYHPAAPVMMIVLVLMSIAGVCIAAYGQRYVLDEFSNVQLDKNFYAEGAAIGDIDGDGHADLIAGPYWFAGPDFKQRHEIYTPKVFDPHGYSDNFFAFTYDFDHDGHLDVLVIGFPGEAGRWYHNPGPSHLDQHWPMHVALDHVDNESPTFTDVTGDGIPEIVCMHGGFAGYAAMPKDPTQPWTFTAVSEKGPYQRFTHGLGVGDINGDGRADILEKSGWFEQPAHPDGKTPWPRHAFNFTGHGGAQMLVFDVDGDGLNDVVTSLNAHGYGLAWFKQIRHGGEITFERHDIMTDSLSFNEYGVAFSQLHALAAADINGDGLPDIVTGKRFWAHHGLDPGASDPAVLYWFQLTRSNGHVGFIPQPVDADSGIGTQVTVGDVNGDKLPDIVVANKKGIFVHRQSRRVVSRDEYFWANHPAMKAVGKTPQQTAAGMTVPKGFHTSLAIGEPDVHQPIAYTIDARGRLWVAENDSYPDWAPTGHDRIMIYEDTNGDGYFDKRTQFYDKLNFVSGIEVGFGGVFVGSSPNLLFIPDRNHDDKPDAEPTVLLDGFGHQDTHEVLNSFIWGPDGWLYGCQGVFTHSSIGKPGTPDAKRTPMNAGIWRYQPLTHHFEVFAQGTSNPWGVDFDNMGNAFSTACVIPHCYHLTLGGRYQRQAGQDFDPYTFEDIKTIADHLHYAGGMRDFGSDATDKAGGGHAHAGAMIYLGDNWPDEYRGKIFMNNIHGNRINMDILHANGSSFIASHGHDFMLANDKWYRGLYLRYGPDGGVYVSDWYDRRACHQQRPHDRTNGRIYKITYGDVKSVRVDLTKKSDAELVAMQLDKNDWYVRTARRLLMQRFADGKLDPATRPALTKIVETNADVSRRLRALWCLHDTGGVDEAMTLHLLDDADANIRGWTIRLALEDRKASDQLVDKLASLAGSNTSSTVHRYLASALQRLPLDQRWGIAKGLLSHGEDASDPDVPLLTWYGVGPLVGSDPAKALALIDHSKLPLVSRFIIRRAAMDPKAMGPLVDRLGATQDVGTLHGMLAEVHAAFDQQAHVPMPPQWEDVYKKLTATGDSKIIEAAQFMAMRFGDRSAFPQMRQLVLNANAPMDQRQSALHMLVAGADADAMPTFQKALDVAPLRLEALKGLAVTEDVHTSDAILQHYGKLNGDEKQAAVATLSARPAYAEALMKAVGRGDVARSDVPLFAIRQMIAMKDKKLTDLIDQHWGKVNELSASAREQIDKWKKLLTPTYMNTADVHNGRAIFARTCAVCHTLYGVGGKIGPDLTGANRNDIDYVLTNVVDPNATIGRDYQLTVITTKDGRSISGIVHSENESALTVQTITDRQLVAKDQIASRQILPISMMPQGLLATMQDSDVRDLVAYLGTTHQVTLPGEAPPIEGESLRVAKVTHGNVRPQNMSGFPADHWSGNAHLWWTDAKPGDELTLAIPVQKSGKYEISVAMTKARDYGIVQLLIDDQPAGKPIDLFNAPHADRSDVINTGPVPLGTFDLTPKSTLSVRIIGANPKALRRYMFAIDTLRITPAK